MKWLLFGLCLLGYTTPTFACEEKLSSLSSAYQCILEKHPSLKRLKLRPAEYEARLQDAGQIQNPELEVKSLVSGDKETEVELLQPIDLAGKRSARKARANAENELNQIQDTESFGEVALGAAESLTKLRQSENELELMREARGSLASILKRLRMKRSLTPEDRIAVSLFQLFESTLGQKINSAEAERDSLRDSIEVLTGRTLSIADWTKEAIRQKNWPALSSREGASTKLRAAQAELSASMAELAEARSESWPELKLGPSFQRINEADNSWGIKASITLPLWNLNGGGRALTRAKSEQAKASVTAASQLEPVTLSSLRTAYEKATSALKDAPKPASLRSLVGETERKFSRGLIQPNALVEVYRSSLEALEVTHQSELQALRSYFIHETSLNRVPTELL